MKSVWLLIFIAIIAASCKNPIRIAEKDNLDYSTNFDEDRSDSWLSLQQRYGEERFDGVDFLAFNSDNTWQLRITNNNEISFDSEYKPGRVRATDVERMYPQDINAVIYGGTNQTERISVMVYSDSCSNTGYEALPNHVTISLRDSSDRIIQFKGCGLYLNDPGLHDIWAIASFTGFGSQDSLPKSAYLEFNMQTQRIYGNLGCGDISGYFTPMGSNLRIYDMDYSDKSCDPNDPSMQLFNLLNFGTHTVLKIGLELKLISQSDTLTLKKAD